MLWCYCVWKPQTVECTKWWCGELNPVEQQFISFSIFWNVSPLLHHINYLFIFPFPIVSNKTWCVGWLCLKCVRLESWCVSFSLMAPLVMLLLCSVWLDPPSMVHGWVWFYIGLETVVTVWSGWEMRRVERAVAGMDVVNNFVCIDVRWTGRGVPISIYNSVNWGN